MLLGDLAQWGITIVTAVALVLTIRRNGKGQKIRDETALLAQAEKEKIQAEKQSEKDQLQAAREAVRGNELKHIKKALDHPEYGLAAIQEDVKAIQINCANVTTGFKEKIETLEKTKGR